MQHVVGVLPYLWEGIQLTFIITIVGVAIGFIVGAFTGLGRLSKNNFIFWLCAVYVEIIRGTPILVQIFFIYFGMADLLDINLDKMTASIIAIALNEIGRASCRERM